MTDSSASVSNGNLQESSEASNECKLDDRYVLIEQIGSGSFGKVYLAEDENGKQFAVKLEKRNNRRQRLYKEAQIYRNLGGVITVPLAFWFGQTEDMRFNALVIELLGPSLSDLFEKCSKQFSLKTILLLADQLISAIDYLHQQGYVHRDIKPSNFLMGTGARDHAVMMVDFGLSEKFRDEDRNHLPNLPRQSVGTPLFSSTRVHESNTPSRRDDLESLCYMLIYFVKGSLPWGGISCKRVQSTWNKVAEKKLTISIEDLCAGLEPEFATFLKYCRNLHYEEEPNYQFLRVLFRVLATRKDVLYDYFFDWMKQSPFVISADNDSSSSSVPASSTSIDTSLDCFAGSNTNQDLTTTTNNDEDEEETDKNNVESSQEEINKIIYIN